MVFSVTGEGGVGKSTLLQQFEDIATAAEVNAIVTKCDDRHISPASVIGTIADALATLDIRHKEFDERYRKYRDLREEIESDPKAPRGVLIFWRDVSPTSPSSQAVRSPVSASFSKAPTKKPLVKRFLN